MHRRSPLTPEQHLARCLTLGRVLHSRLNGSSACSYTFTGGWGCFREIQPPLR
uniref:Uncharacterized protein n=1 Tax=Anguilla anguilla TaxID=7936 RepID=A0A0E9PZE7_ANGAN